MARSRDRGGSSIRPVREDLDSLHLVKLLGSLYWELVLFGQAVEGSMYIEQLEWLFYVLCTLYPSFLNWNRAHLQHPIAAVHTSKVVS